MLFEEPQEVSGGGTGSMGLEAAHESSGGILSDPYLPCGVDGSMVYAGAQAIAVNIGVMIGLSETQLR